MPVQYDNDDGPAASGVRLGGPIFEGGYFTSRYIQNIASKTLVARGLEERRNFEEFLTKSVGHVHFP